MTLTEFLLARIADDEGGAHDAMSGEVMGGHPVPTFDLELSQELVTGFTGFLEIHPGRVLAECEAKRRIVEMCTPFGWTEDGEPIGSSYVDAWWEALQNLALPYAKHPDYD